MVLRAVIVLSSIIVISVSGCTRFNEIWSSPVVSPKTIDGDRSDWVEKFSVPKDQKFALAVSHTDNYLYVGINTLDRDVYRLLSMAGFTIWIDESGKKKRDLGIRYLGGVRDQLTNRELTSNRGQRETHALAPEDFQSNNEAGAGRRPTPKLEGNLMLIVLDSEQSTRLGPADLQASAMSRDNSLFIEIQIPMALISPAFNAEKQISLGFIAEQDRPEGARPGMNPEHGGKSGMRGGGRSGGMQGGGQRAPASRPSAETEIELWTRLTF